MIPLILSGGSGSRLWPVSRESYPKQFCELFDVSFMLNTYSRLTPLGEPYIVTLSSMADLTQRALRSTGFSKANLVSEPMGKNTAPAIALFLHIHAEKLKKDDIIGVFPADHVIANEKIFQQAMSLGESIAKEGKVVTLGVRPSYPATGFGYIQMGPIANQKNNELSARPVLRFTEKPNAAKAAEYFHSGNNFWNAGIFIFSVETIQNLFLKWMPELNEKIRSIKKDLSNLSYVYANIQSQSLDYGILEKAENVVCIAGDYGWSDVGSWDEISRIAEEEKSLKIDSKAAVFNQGSEENFVYSSHNKVVGLVDVQGLIVVDTPDALLVTKKDHSQGVKNLVDMMRGQKLFEASEHRFEVRPWGKFEILSDLPDHKVKRLTVDPGGRLSYQMHQKRDEHWVIIAGQAEITMENKKYVLSKGQQFFAPRGHKHRIANTSSEPLVIIEVQTGAYFGEDDIERFQDDYKRI